MKKPFIQIWGDVVDSKELIISIFIISSTTMISYLLAPSSKTIPLNLFFGLGGAILGFIITAIIIKPKRIIHKEDE